MKTSIRRTFLIIQTMVALLLVFLVIQCGLVWRVCRQGTQATQGLEREGIPSQRYVATLQQNINLYRLHSYELMFVQEPERPAKVAQADALQRQNVALLDQLKGFFPTGPGQQLVATASANLAGYATAMEQLRAKIDKDFPGAMQMLDQEIPGRVAQLNNSVTKLASYCDTLATERLGQTVGGFASIKTTALGFGAASIGFAAVVVALVTFNSSRIRQRLAQLVYHLSESSDIVNNSGRSVTAASQSLAEGASQQAASLEETSASLEEISSMTRRNAENVASAKEFTSQTRATAESGAQSTQEMGRAMQDIRNASGEMRDAMNGIKSASNDVSKIIKTIDEIAFQTNLLALNAAVEAARAGEAGAGFAVVADEVRSLAQRSAKAAKETTNLIETSVQRSEAGVRVTDKVVTSVAEVVAKSHQLEQKLAEILTKAQKVDEQVAQIASASQEQSMGISEVNMAVSQMDQVTQGNAATAEESAAAAEELSAQAEVLKGAVIELESLVGGSASAAATHPKAQASSPRTVPGATHPNPRSAQARNFPMPDPSGANHPKKEFADF